MQNIIAQETRLAKDTISIKYIFWSSPKYSLNSGMGFKNTNNNLTCRLKPNFKVLFDMNSEEYKYLKRSERKLTIGNFAFAVPGAVCLCIATSSGLNRNTRNSLIIGGSALLVLDISIGINGFKDIKKAAIKRNKRIRES
jgi:hypothetical protein